MRLLSGLFLTVSLTVLLGCSSAQIAEGRWHRPILEPEDFHIWLETHLASHGFEYGTRDAGRNEHHACQTIHFSLAEPMKHPHGLTSAIEDHLTNLADLEMTSRSGTLDGLSSTVLIGSDRSIVVAVTSCGDDSYAAMIIEIAK